MVASARMIDDERGAILEAHRALIDAGALEPLAHDGEETRRWLDCELASLVENRFFVALDPRALTPEDRERWEPRATSDEPLSSPHGHDWYRLPYWIRDGGERAGIMALATAYLSGAMVTVSSLYTFPSHRRRGIAGRIVRRAQAAVKACGAAGLRVPTHWTWQPAVRFYQGLGMWVRDWKHALVFHMREDGGPYVDIGEHEARFGVVRAGHVTPLITATRDGDQLGWSELDALEALADDDAEDPLYFDAIQTFAVALAMRGWPLIRSDAAWARRKEAANGGDPEGLAYKIESWEAWERQSGHDVRTPRIPGLAYRAVDAID
ncbi:Hypothetical protein A7982_02425 [Minicystis rosea]|nr:Hypothetical protein A7982_02425 [Minicystis rosea]